LARYRHNVVLFDSGESRADLIPESHNYPGFAQGVSGRKLLALLKEQAHAYGVAMVGSRVTSLSRPGSGRRKSPGRSQFWIMGLLSRDPSMG
jgi:thioredoxin reductase (NADPH)